MSAFDPGGFFEFDLARGAVNARGTGRVLVLSDSVVAPLVSAAVGNGDLTAVRKLGRQLGVSVAESFPSSVSDEDATAVLEHIAGVLSVFGWGRLVVERWGDAVVAHLEDLPRLDPEHLGIAALLGGLFSAISSREVACVPVSDEGAFMVVDPNVAQQIWKWSRGGDDIAAIVGRLSNPGAA